MLNRLSIACVLAFSLTGCAGGWFDFSGGLPDGTTVDVHKPPVTPEVPAETPAEAPVK